MKKPSLEEIADKLQQGPFRQGLEIDRLADPISDTPMVITLEQLRPYEHNPRLIRNPLYDDIKASIRERGLDQPPPITRRPGEVHFIIRNGGNTRLAILGELWQETRDEQFFRIHCLFKPWINETSALLGHLAESDLHGSLTFIERALAVAKLNTMFEQEGRSPSQRELASRLRAQGYPVSQPHLSKMFETLEHLLPGMPQVLYGGLGKPSIERLLSLRRCAEHAWQKHQGQIAEFVELWRDTLADFDALPDEFDPERVQDELLERMSRALDQSQRTLALDLADMQSHGLLPPFKKAAIPPPVLPAGPEIGASSTQATRSSPTHENLPVEQNPPDTEIDEAERQRRIQDHVISPVLTTPRVQHIREQIAREAFDEVLPNFEECAVTAIPVQVGGLHPVSDIWYIERQLDSPACLRAAIANLAREMAVYAGKPDSVMEQDNGLGFAVRMALIDLDTPRATGIHLLLTALLRAQDEVDWQDRRQLPSALFGQLLLGVYQLPLADRPALDVGLERLPDGLLIKLFRLIRLARRLIDLTSAEGIPGDES
jgi:ParB family protein of integrating conjugative element (PFGI_1 class)